MRESVAEELTKFEFLVELLEVVILTFRRPNRAKHQTATIEESFWCAI